MKSSGQELFAFDLIGDLHGHADELVELLTILGYSERSGVFRHPTRTVIFCGDFIDRGPQIRDVLTIVRNMVENGSAQAVMGNHEYNAIAYHTERTDVRGEFYRRHSAQNVRQHLETMNQLSSGEMLDALAWFRSLPIALDLGKLRVVHACWDPSGIQLILRALKEFGRFSTEFLDRSTCKDHELFEAVERVLKGPELSLPAGFFVRDKEGSERKQIRIRWFEEPANHSFSTYALPTAVHDELALRPLEGNFRPVPYPADGPPVFIGHYWMNDTVPHPLTGNIACLDYSVAKDGYLCAYRFDGESQLLPSRFVTVASRKRS